MEVRGYVFILCSCVKLDGGEIVIGIYGFYYKFCGYFFLILNLILLFFMIIVYSFILIYYNISLLILIKIY